MADPKLTIVIEQKGADGVVQSIKQIEKQGSTTYTKLIKEGKVVSESMRTVTGATKLSYGAVTALNTGYLALSQTYMQVKGGLDGLIGAGIEELDSIRKRDTALKNAGDSNLKYKDSLEKQAQQFSESLGVADDYTRMIQAQLLIQHKSPQDIGMMTQAVLGLTLQQDIGIDTAARMIAKFVEQGGALRGTTLKADEHSSAQDRLRQVMEFTTTGVETQRKKMKENEGQLQLTKVKYDEMRETIGIKLLPVVSNLAEKFGKMLDTFNKLDPSAQNAVLFGAAAAIGLAPLITALSNVIIAIDVINKSWLGMLIAKVGPVAAFGVVGGAAGAIEGGAQQQHSEAWTMPGGFTSTTTGKTAPRNRGGGKVNEDMLIMMRGGVLGRGGGSGDPLMDYLNAGGDPGPGWSRFSPGDGGGMTLSKAFGPSGLAGIAGATMSGGIGGGVQSALAMAGGAIGGPIGSLLGGLLGGGLGKLFGGGKKNRQGETPGQPVYVEDVRMNNQLTDFLNATKLLMLRGAGAGIDNGVRQVGMQNARAGM